MKSQDTKAVVLFNVYGHLNGGDAMLLEALVDLVSKTHPEAHLSGIAFDPISEREWMPSIIWHERIANTLSRGIFGRGWQGMCLVIGVLLAFGRPFWPLRWVLPKEQRKAVEALSNCDLAISAPGGYLEDSNSAYLLNLLQILLARRLCSHVILAPQSIGPIRNGVGKKLARWVLSGVDHLFVREHWSYEFVERLFGNDARIPQAKISSSGDLAFWFSPKHNSNTHEEAQRIGIDLDRKILGLTMVDWSFPDISNPKNAREAYLDAVCALVDHVNISGTHQIVIFNQVAADLPLALELRKRRPNVVVDTRTRSSSLLAALISMSDVFIGTRFHSCIFALMGSVPTCAISYLPKTRGIMEDLRLSTFVVDINSVCGIDLTTSFDQLSQNRAEHSAIVANAVKRYRTEQRGFVSYLEHA